MEATEALPAADIARRVGVKAETVLVWARAGLIPCIRITRKVVRFQWQDVMAALRERGPLPAGGGR